MAKLDLSVDPKRCFAERMRKADDAARLVASGDVLWIPIGHTPFAVLGALAAREKELRGVKIRAALIPDLGWFRSDVREHFDLQVQFAILPDNRKALADNLPTSGLAILDFAIDDWEDVAFRRGKLVSFVSPRLSKHASDE